MVRAPALPLLFLLSIGCAKSPEMRVVDDAASAMGDWKRVETLSLQGEGDAFALGQNRTLGGELLSVARP